MTNVSELRLSPLHTIGLAEPGHRTANPGTANPGTANPGTATPITAPPAPSPRPAAGPAGSPAVAPAPPDKAPALDGSPAEPAAKSKPSSAEIHRRFAHFERMDYADGIPDSDLGFGEFLDIVNPLQHIPVVGTLYRSITGDEISQSASILGGFLYGGPVGFVAAIAGAIAEQTMGQSLGEAALAALFDGGDTGEDLGDVQLAERPGAATAAEPATAETPIEPPVQSGVQPASLDAAAPASLGGSQAFLTGRGALDALIQDLKDGGQLVEHGATEGAPSAAMVPSLPMPPSERRMQLAARPAEAARIGALRPGFAAGKPLAEAAEISGQSFSERMIEALDKYRAMTEARAPGDEDRASRFDTRL